MNKIGGITEAELIQLSEERFLTKGQVSESAECYGAGRLIKKYGFYPTSLPLCVGTDHSPTFRDHPSRVELTLSFPVFFFHAQRLVREWRKIKKIPCFSLMSPFVFYRRISKIEKSIDAKGTLVFPSHSTDLIDIEHDINKYIEELNRLPEECKPISVCMYYKDIQKGRHKIFLERGIPVYTAGHMYDSKFLNRFYDLLKNYKFTTSHVLGSYTFYAVEMGIPFFLYGKRPPLRNEGDPNLNLGYVEAEKECPLYVKAMGLFDKISSEITSEQKQFVNAELGVETSISRLFCSFLLYYSFGIYTFKSIIRKIPGLVRFKNFMRYGASNLYDYLDGKTYAFINKINCELNIFSHMTTRERIELHRLIKKFNKPIEYAEIGSYLGASSAIAANGGLPGSKIYCIDTWGNHAMSYQAEDIDAYERDTYQEFLKNVDRYSDKIVPIRGWSYDVYFELRKKTNSLDVLFIDGDHEYDGIRKDWDYYSNLVLSGGYIAFHDTGWAEGVNKLIHEELNNSRYFLYKELPNLKIFKVK